MKAVVVTTITSTFDFDTMKSSHEVDVEDQDRLSEVSTEVLGALLSGGLKSTLKALGDQFPSVKHADVSD